MKKPTKPVAKKAKAGTKAEQAASRPAKAALAARAGGKAQAAKARAAKARPKPVRRASRAAPEPVNDAIEAYGEAEAPPEDFGQDRSRQRAKFRELSWAQFDTLVQGLSREIGRAFKTDVVVGVAHGGVFVGAAVARVVGCEFFPVRISRRSRDTSSGSPRGYGEMPAELKGRRVLIVDDVSSSGDTLELAQALARKAGARDVATACLVSKENGYRPGWSALQTDELVVFPWDYGPIVEERRF